MSIIEGARRRYRDSHRKSGHRRINSFLDDYKWWHSSVLLGEL